MDLVEIDPIGSQTLERGLAGRREVQRARVVRHPLHDATLGRQQHPTAQPWRLRQYAAEEILGGAVFAVDVRVIEEVDPHRESGLDLLPSLAYRCSGEAPAAVG